jgi:hypothetical protein
MPDVYFDASFAGIYMLIANIDSESGRDIAVQSPARGDRHVLQDRGRKLLSTTCEMLFVPQPGLGSYLERFDQFRALAEGGKSDVFSHPLLGSYRARIGDFRFRASEDAAVEVTCTILAEDEPTVVFRAGAGISTEAGVEAVSAAAAAADTELAAVDLESDVPSSALAQVTAWASGEDLDSADVFAQVATVSSQIDDAITALDLTSDLSRWEAYKQMIRLQYEVQRAAEAAVSDADNVFDLTVRVPRPLRAICAELYGAALAEDRATKIAKLNRLRTPGLVPAGSRLKMISNGARVGGK